MGDLRFLVWVSVLVLGLSVSASAQSEGVDGPSRRMDVAFLDSLLAYFVLFSFVDKYAPPCCYPPLLMFLLLEGRRLDAKRHYE